jgi:hypothetical protein
MGIIPDFKEKSREKGLRMQESGVRRKGRA